MSVRCLGCVTPTRVRDVAIRVPVRETKELENKQG